jgi:hypothetical protein
MPKKQSRPIRRMPWARHHFKEGTNGWDKGCSECQAEAEWTIDWEYVHNGEEWRGAVCPKHDPGPVK